MLLHVLLTGQPLSLIQEPAPVVLQQLFVHRQVLVVPSIVLRVLHQEQGQLLRLRAELQHGRQVRIIVLLQLLELLRIHDPAVLQPAVRALAGQLILHHVLPQAVATTAAQDLQAGAQVTHDQAVHRTVGQVIRVRVVVLRTAVQAIHVRAVVRQTIDPATPVRVVHRAVPAIPEVQAVAVLHAVAAVPAQVRHVVVHPDRDAKEEKSLTEKILLS